MKKSFKAKGSFTLEAAIIVSITMFICAAAILLSFNIHDKVVMQCDPAAAILKNAGSDKKEDISAIKGDAEAALNSNIIKTDSVSVSADFGEDKYTLSCLGQFDWIFDPVKNFVSESLEGSGASVTISELDGRKTLLRIRRAKELLEGAGENKK